MLEAEEKRLIVERKRNLLYLIAQYLTDIGLNTTKTSLINEVNLSAHYNVCDNVDLETMYMDFGSYYQLKFGKMPKIVKQISSPQNVISDTKSNNQKTKSIDKRVTQSIDTINKEKNKIANTTNINFENTMVISALNVPNSEQKVTNQGTVINDVGDCIPNCFVKLRPPLSNYEKYTPEWEDLAKLICRDIVQKKLGISWDQVHGVDKVITILKESVLMPLEYPEVFVGVMKPWKGVLMHGPPGTGKTLIAKALCTETFEKVTFFNVAASTIISKWRGESEKYIRVLFEVAKFYSPSVIFIDEIEGIASHRDGVSEHEASKRFKNEFLTLFDGLESTNFGIFILGNTNLPWEIDKAFLRRFERKILIDLPNRESRREIFKQNLPHINKWKKELLEKLEIFSEGFTGDDIRIACKEAAMSQIRTLIHKKEKLSNWADIEITESNLLEAVKQIKPSSMLIVEKYRKWHDEFGTKL